MKPLNIKLLVFPLIVTSLVISSQSPDEKKKIFAQAELHFLYEEFDLANSLYLLLETPESMNIKYKIGTCYLPIEGEKQKSIPYLEDALKNVSSAIRYINNGLSAYCTMTNGTIWI